MGQRVCVSLLGEGIGRQTFTQRDLRMLAQQRHGPCCCDAGGDTGGGEEATALPNVYDPQSRAAHLGRPGQLSRAGADLNVQEPSGIRCVTAILDFAAVNCRPGSFNVDIGINNTDGLRAITIVNEYLSKMPALRSLIFIVKGFLSQRNLNNAA